MEAGKETSGLSSGGIKKEDHTMAAKVQWRNACIIIRTNSIN